MPNNYHNEMLSTALAQLNQAHRDGDWATFDVALRDVNRQRTLALQTMEGMGQSDKIMAIMPRDGTAIGVTEILEKLAMDVTTLNRQRIGASLAHLFAQGRIARVAKGMYKVQQ